MTTLTIRKLPDEVHRALRLRAAKHGRSTEAEIRCILENAVKSDQLTGLGDALAALGRDIGLQEEDFPRLEQLHDATPAEPMKFE
jgi:antitoxin FitA